MIETNLWKLANAIALSFETILEMQQSWPPEFVTFDCSLWLLCFHRFHALLPRVFSAGENVLLERFFVEFNCPCCSPPSGKKNIEKNWISRKDLLRELSANKETSLKHFLRLAINEFRLFRWRESVESVGQVCPDPFYVQPTLSWMISWKH